MTRLIRSDETSIAKRANHRRQLREPQVSEGAQMGRPACPLDLPLHTNLGMNAVEGFFAKLTNQRLKRGVFRSVCDVQAAINRFVDETNSDPKPNGRTQPCTRRCQTRKGKVGVDPLALVAKRLSQSKLLIMRSGVTCRSAASDWPSSGSASRHQTSASAAAS